MRRSNFLFSYGQYQPTSKSRQRTPTGRRKSGPREPKSKTSGVYLIEFTDSGCEKWYKIGRAADIRSRLSGHQTSLPFPVTLVATIECNPREAVKLEQTLHKALERFWVRGEWYKGTSEVEQTFKSYPLARGSQVPDSPV